MPTLPNYRTTLGVGLANFINVVFPMTAIERRQLELLDRHVIETANVNVITLGVRSRTVKAVNSAVFAK
jgi:hypothetical protein